MGHVTITDITCVPLWPHWLLSRFPCTLYAAPLVCLSDTSPFTVLFPFHGPQVFQGLSWTMTSPSNLLWSHLGGACRFWASWELYQHLLLVEAWWGGGHYLPCKIVSPSCCNVSAHPVLITVFTFVWQTIGLTLFWKIFNPGSHLSKILIWGRWHAWPMFSVWQC